MNNKVTYRQQYTRCGKERCRKCREGEGHGPYWYAYWSENGRTISKYIGVRLPDDVEKTRKTGDEERSTPFDAAITSNQPILRIYLLGQFRIERLTNGDWRAVTNRTWQRRRARALLGCLLSSPGRQLGREQVMEALWPDLDIETAANRLNGAVHELRQILEPEIARPANSRMLLLERDVLRLADRQQIWVDAEEFERLLTQANSADKQGTEKLLDEASELYHGDYLPEELYAEWAGPRRDALRRRWMGLLLNLAELRASRNALASAIEPLDRLLSTDPTHETAVRHLMLLLTQLDRRGEALRVYHRLETMLQRDYDSEPLPETRELYEALRQGHLRVSGNYPVPPPSKPSTPSTATGPSPMPIGAGARPTFQPDRDNQSPFIGREQEMETIRQLMQTTEQSNNPLLSTSKAHPRHSPHFLLLMGEAGIGKTRLAEEFSNEAVNSGWTVVWSRAYEQEATIPYRPWIEILRTLLNDFPLNQFIHTDLSDVGDQELSQTRIERLSLLLPDLREFFPLSSKSLLFLPPEQERLHLWEATLELFMICCQKAPLLLVLDDLHWTDDSSLELLAYLARHLQKQQVLLIGTCRNLEIKPEQTLQTLMNDLQREQAIVTLPIEPLSRSEIGSMFTHLPQNIVQRIQSQAGGNPFFAEELARYSSSAPQAGGKEQEVQQLPSTITAVLERRLSKLSAACQALLSKAAVLGGSFELEHLLFMTDQGHNNHEDEILDLLEEALRAGLVCERGSGLRISYDFWHPLIVSHLYERISAARRAQLHRRAAQALLQLYQGSEGEVAASITHHLSKGGSSPTQIAHYAELAGNRAYSMSAYSEAHHYYLQAIQITVGESFSNENESTTLLWLKQQPDSLHLARLLERLAEVCQIQGSYDEARQLYTRTLELRSRPGQFPSVEERQQEAQIQALIWREIGRTWVSKGEFGQGHECFQKAKEVLLEAGIQEGTAWAGLQLQNGVMSCIEGNFEEARRCANEALEMLQRTHPNLEQQGRRQEELQTLTARTATGNPLEIGHAHELIGVIAASEGRLPEALQHLETALKTFEQHDLVVAVTRVCGNIGTVYALRSEHNLARMYLQRSFELAERTGDLPNKAFIMGNRGQVAARTGDLHEAESLFVQSLAFGEQVNEREHVAWSNVSLAITLQDLGEVIQAGTHLRQAFLLSRGLQNSVICLTLTALGDFRVLQAMLLVDMLKRKDGQTRQQQLMSQPLSRRLLLKAHANLRRALALEGVELETVVETKYSLARVLFLSGEIEESQYLAEQTLEEARQHEITSTIARTQRLLGTIYAFQGHYTRSEELFEHTSELFRTYGMRLDYARTLKAYAETLLDRKQEGESLVPRAIQYLKEALTIFSECHALIDETETKRLLARLEHHSGASDLVTPLDKASKKKSRGELPYGREYLRPNNLATAGTDTP